MEDDMLMIDPARRLIMCGTTYLLVRNTPMSATTTRAPSRAKSSAVARPIPDPDPVMMQTFSGRRVNAVSVRSLRREAAIDRQRYAGDETRRRRGEEEHGRRNLGRCRQATERLRKLVLAPGALGVGERVDELTQHWRIDDPGAHGIDSDPFGRPVERQRAGQLNRCTFRRYVNG